MEESRRRAIVVGGSVASGKTGVLRQFVGVDQFNVDDRCARLNGGSYQRLSPQVITQGTRECEAWIGEHIREGVSFVLESRFGAVGWVIAAQEAGFEAEVVWVGTVDPEINIKRHLARMAAGGREAEVRFVRESCAAATENLAEVLREVENVEVWDTSGVTAELQLRIRRRAVEYEAEGMKLWVREALETARELELERATAERTGPER